MNRTKTLEIKWDGGDFTTEELGRAIRWYHHDFGCAIDNLAVKEVGNPERLRLLEAVAKAMQADARIYLDLTGGEGMTFTEYLTKYGNQMSAHGQASLEALAALEAHDE